MKIFLTGADGFIGSHLTEMLVNQGYDVRCLVLYNSFNSWGWLENCDSRIKKDLDVVFGDIRDPFAMRRLIDGCDKVIHLAALIAIPYSYLSPASYVETNVNGTLNVLEIARQLEIDQVIHTSTSEVYGTAQYAPIDESHPLNAQSPYAASKIAADQLALSFWRSFATPVSVLRPFNTYGPRQSARAVIPTIIKQLQNNPAQVALGSTEPTRDFSFVTDTASGFLAALNSPSSIGTVTNIGSSFEISIGDTVREIANLMGLTPEIVTDADRLRPKDSEVDRLLACSAKARSTLEWSPEYAGISGFRLGLTKTLEWFQQPENLSRYKIGTYDT